MNIYAINKKINVESLEDLKESINNKSMQKDILLLETYPYENMDMLTSRITFLSKKYKFVDEFGNTYRLEKVLKVLKNIND